MKISEKTFNLLYPDLEGMYQHFVTPPPADISDDDFERLYLSSKLWRLNNCYYVIDKWGNKVKFVMNLAQHIVYSALRRHPRLIILKSRQQGISTFWLICFYDDAFFIPNTSVGLMAQGTDEAATLLERAKLLWDNMHSRIKQRMRRSLDKDNLKEYSFNNNSKIFIRVSFRSTTLQRLHVSELGKIANSYPQRAREVKTGTLQALAKGMPGVLESTAEGNNMFKLMWDEAVRVKALETGYAAKDFQPIFLSWLDDPDCVEQTPQPIDEGAARYFDELEKLIGRQLTPEQKNFWVAQRRELGDDIFQEYPATPEEAFTAIRDGTYYNKLYMTKILRRNRCVPKLYDENLSTDVYFDLGVDDYTAVAYVQAYQDGVRIVEEDWNSGKSIEYYIDRILESGKPIRYWVFPHDVAARQLTNGNNGIARTRKQIIMEYLRDKSAPGTILVGAKLGIADGIEAVRQLMEYMWIDPRCAYLISCFQNYSKEFDEKLGVFRDTPLHDEYSHGADLFRLIAQLQPKLYPMKKGLAYRGSAI